MVRKFVVCLFFYIRLLVVVKNWKRLKCIGNDTQEEQKTQTTKSERKGMK